jgi:two-component system, OmpR family, phosphate regulon sensor histidine kinase PhoR
MSLLARLRPFGPAVAAGAPLIAAGSALAAAAAIVAGLTWLAVGLAVAAAVIAVASRPRRKTQPAGTAAPTPAIRPPGFEALSPLLEAMPDPALLIDREGRIAGANSAARAQLKFEADGLKLASILRRPELLDAADAAVQDGASQTVFYESASPVEEHFKAYIAPVAWGGASAALMVFHNQTQLIATERMRADFLANASHELRTPIAALLLLIETLSGHAKGDPAAQAQFMGMMQGQILRMKRLIDDLLSLSKIELNEHVPPTDKSELWAVAQEAVGAVRPLADERGVHVEAVLESDAGPVVLGDRFQLVQVAQNLIDNAIKYSPRGGHVRVLVGLGGLRDEAADFAGRRWEGAGRSALLTPPPSQSRRFAYLRVEDNGAGIERRYLPRLSERFYRVERDDNPERSGTGLGLAIVKHIVNRHRGGFMVESIPGQGSAFCILVEKLPVKQPVEARQAVS